jgi:tetratricopeptide (TPR) repeat protein
MDTVEFRGSIASLIREVRTSGSAQDWPGSGMIAEAVATVLSDSVILNVPEAASVDILLATVTTSWAMAILEDECPIGRDVPFWHIDSNTPGGWGLSNDSERRVFRRAVEIYQARGCPVHVGSLAAFLALCLDENSDGACDAIGRAKVLFRNRRHDGSPEATWPHIPEDTLGVVSWIRSAARVGPLLRGQILAGISSGTITAHGDSRAFSLFGEFGYASLWASDNTDELTAALMAIYPYCAGDAVGRPAPDFDEIPFSERHDMFFRRIIIDRLCKLWTVRPANMAPWSANQYQVLLPFAYYVVVRACTDRTRDLAGLLVQICYTMRCEALWRQLLERRVSELPNGPRFTRLLFGWGIIVAIVIGALFTLPAAMLSGSGADIVASSGLVATAWFIHWARRAAHFTVAVYPRKRSLVAGFLLGTLYSAASLGALWLHDRYIDSGELPGTLISLPIVIIALTVTARRGITWRIPDSAILPEGAPEDVADQFDEVIHIMTYVAHPTWARAIRQRIATAERSLLLSPLGRPKAALAASNITVPLLRRLAQNNPEAYEASLADTLHGIGWMLWRARLYEDAVDPLMEAVQISRRLALADPARVEPGLASSLHNLGVSLFEAGRQTEALAACQEAVTIRTRLAAANPAVHKADLAHSLHELGCYLNALGRTDEALAAVQKTLDIRTRLAGINPAVHEADLARSLHELGCYLNALGRTDEALAAVQKTLDIRTRLAAANPAVHQAGLAHSLYMLGLMLMQAGSAGEALAPMEEAVLIRRQLSLVDPVKFKPDFAASLYEYGWILSRVEQHMNALAPTIEAVQIYRQLARSSPDMYQAILSRAEYDLGQRLQEIGQANTPASIEAILRSARQQAPILPSSRPAYRSATKGGQPASYRPPNPTVLRTTAVVPTQVPYSGHRSHHLPAIVLADALTIAALTVVAVAMFLGRNQPSVPAVEARMLTVGQLQVGDCLRGSNMGLGTDAAWPHLVAEVPCPDEHTAQVFYVAYWPHKLSYPGTKAVNSESDTACSKAFGGYVNILLANSSFSIIEIVPEPSSSWASGDRTLVCLAYRATSGHPDGSPLYRSIEGSRY